MRCAALLCENCILPGRCCAGFALEGNARLTQAETVLEASALLAAMHHIDDTAGPASLQIGVPFTPLWRTPEGKWRYWCVMLGRDGRCTDYENRPRLCRNFTAGVDRLCAMQQS